MEEGTATVVQHAGGHYMLSPLPQWAPLPAVLKGGLRLEAGHATNPVAIGDWVRYVREDADAVAAIVETLPRKNHLVRRSANLSRQTHVIAANLDRVLLVCSLFFPQTRLPLIDRMLVACQAYGIPVTLVVSKTDLYREEAPEELVHFCEIYTRAGYPVVETSVPDGKGIPELREACKGNVCLLTGESGVGKSALIHAMDPCLTPKVGAISTAHLQGRHTTSRYEIYPLLGGAGGFVIDSPGLRGFGLSGVAHEETANYFPEMLRHAPNCRFVPCTHTHEPGCAVKAAVERGEIAPERYASYLGMLEEDRKFR